MKTELFISCLFLYLLCGIQFSHSQQLSFSKDDNAFSSDKHWEMPIIEDGKLLPVTVVATYQPTTQLKGKKGYLFIDKEEPLGGFEEYKSMKVWVLNPSSVQEKITIDQPGRYLVYYANERKKVLHHDTLYIHAPQEIFFCEDLGPGNQPIGMGRTFYPSSTGLYYYQICARSNIKFDTHQLITEIYEYKVGDYRKPISTSTDYVNPDWRRVFFRGPMLKPGQYRVKLSKANGEPFAIGYFTLAPEIK